MTYTGEHTFAGQLGHWLTLTSFVCAVFAGLAFLLNSRNGDMGWRSLGRLFFRLHSVAVIGVVVTLFIMLFNHWYEYDYVWKHSNSSMPLRYIASCFWEGQEGSFLLFTFWNMVLGNILIFRAKEWEGPVLAVFALAQVFLASMLLGVHIIHGEAQDAFVRIGSSPFLLIRELPENIGLPWTRSADYLSKIPQFKDGRGLNPLLQNYWMVLHPPTLFLGFSATLVPFAYAIAGLWKDRLKEWITPALPWVFFGIMVLGTGILMGGAWAYEALSFGGFWAWDPVENGSLVPWIVLVGSGHLMLINKRKPTSLFTTLLLVLGTWLLVLYSTFLTRSGVLGDTSVHSFTGEGMMPGLLTLILTFVVLGTVMLNRDRQVRLWYTGLSTVLLLLGWWTDRLSSAILIFAGLTLATTVVAYGSRTAFKDTGEEEVTSREFWLFIGSLVLLLSAVQITWTTSIPVYNLLLEPLGDAVKRAPPVESIPHYNKWQIPFAFIVSLLVAVGQYLRYGSTDVRRCMRELALSLLGSVLITGLCVWLLRYRANEATVVALIFATSFAALANTAYIFRVLKGSLRNAGPSIAHTGFALVLLGATISTSKQEAISRNVKGPRLSTMSNEFNDSEEMLLYKGDTVPIGDRFVTYTGSRKDGVNLHFDMDYLRAVPRHFKAGDTVRVRNSIFVATDDHVAGNSFLLDQPTHWRPLDSAAHRVYWHASAWSSTLPAGKEFSLEPFVQLNPRFGNVAEPSTRHWPQRDLYTHIRYAKLDPEDTTDFMPPRLFEKSVGDTIITPTCLIVVDSVRAVRDSVIARRLGPEFVAYAPILKVRDLYDPTRWFEARPVIIYRHDQVVGSKGFGIPALNMKLDVSSVKDGVIGINVYEREFVIMQAIVFPGINVLWIGCVLMAIGTGMAVWRRVRR